MSTPTSASLHEDLLVRGFASPPNSAKPRVWWHWMNGNITHEGIEKDLQWMKRVGIGGLQNFDAAYATPQVVDERLIYMSPAWQEAFRYAVRRATELGFEFAIASSPGFSETGGPWVQPKDGMKKLVWSETRIRGGTPFQGALQAPPSSSGPFQNLPMIDVVSRETVEGPSFYRDIAVLAYPTANPHSRPLKPLAVTTNAPAVDAVALASDDPIELVALPLSPQRSAWVLYDYGSPHQFQAASLARPVRFSMTAYTWTVEASLDGNTFQCVTDFPADASLSHITVSFPQIIARFIRLVITAVPRKIWFEFAANARGVEPVPIFSEPAQTVEIYQLRFIESPRVHRFEEKAGFAVAADYYELDCAGGNAPGDAINLQAILNLTDRLRPDGTLHWNVPEGDWTVLRLGYSLTGKTNHPASPEATGLEVDKLDKHAVREYLDHYLGTFERTVGNEWMGWQGIRAFLTDSIESRGQNWTPSLIGEFRLRRGYDPTLWLPTLTGVPIEDASHTDRFLWDFRKTLLELLAEAHYGQIATSVHARGLTYYSESLEGYPEMALGDDLDMRAPADIPMAAIWTNYKAEERDGIPNHIVDMLGAASVAHVLGKNIVAVEALTSGYEPWVFSPMTLRPVIDLAFALGMNRPVIHTSVHQPVEKKPGLSLGPYGQHFTRHETWAELAGAWITYLSRCSFFLQQGTPVTDVAWFYGEGGSLTGLCGDGLPPGLPEGYGFDFISPKMLLNDLYSREGQLISSGGARYELLYLGGTSERMTLTILRKLKTLVDEGITIAGCPPHSSPSLADEGRELEYRELVASLWDTNKIINVPDANVALKRMSIAQDFTYSSRQPNSSVLFRHRALPDCDVYFVTNRKARFETIEARFRITGRRAELWHADTGERERVPWHNDGTHTWVPLELDANESVFIVFREKTQRSSEDHPIAQETPLLSLKGDWDLTFESNRGGPTGVHSVTPGSWSESLNPGVKYFSGIGTYRKPFTVDELHLGPDERVILDLGAVHELAEVTLNDSRIGTTWHAPYRVDVTEKLKVGHNVLEVRVANLWVNRLIGDQQPGATPVAFTATSTYAADAPLRPAGLIGPVTLIRHYKAGTLRWTFPE